MYTCLPHFFEIFINGIYLLYYILYYYKYKLYIYIYYILLLNYMYMYYLECNILDSTLHTICGHYFLMPSQSFTTVCNIINMDSLVVCCCRRERERERERERKRKREWERAKDLFYNIFSPAAVQKSHRVCCCLRVLLLAVERAKEQ